MAVTRPTSRRRVLQRGHHGQGRFGPLVLVATMPMRGRRTHRQSSARRATRRRRSRPGTIRSPARRPVPNAGHRSVAWRERRHLPAPPPRSAAGRNRGEHRRPSSRPRVSPTGGRRRVSFSRSQPSRRRPSSRARASPRCSPAARSASGSAAFAYRRRASGHGHVWLPVGRPTRQRRRAEQPSRHRVLRADAEDLCRTERGEGHRPAMTTPPPRAVAESGGGEVADGEVAGACRGGPQPPQRPSPAVLDAGVVLPLAIESEPVVATPVGSLGGHDEVQVAPCQVGRGRPRDPVLAPPRRAPERRRRGSTRAAVGASSLRRARRSRCRH